MESRTEMYERDVDGCGRAGRTAGMGRGVKGAGVGGTREVGEVLSHSRRALGCARRGIMWGMRCGNGKKSRRYLVHAAFF